MILTVANQKGGVGKTTFLVNFAYYLNEKKNKSVCVIDTDTQGNCSYSLNGAKILGDTYSLFTNNILSDKSFNCNSDKSNLCIFQSSVELAEEDEFNTQDDYLHNYLQNIKHLYTIFDCILIDTAPVLSNKMIYSLQVSDYVVTPIELEVFSLQGLELMLNTIFNIKQEYNKNMNFLGVLPSRVNTTNQRQLNTLNELKTEYGEELFLPYIKNRNHIADALANQISFFKSNSKYKKELLNVFDFIYNKIKGDINE